MVEDEMVIEDLADDINLERFRKQQKRAPRRRMAILKPKWTVPTSWCNHSKPQDFTDVVIVLNESHSNVASCDWIRQKLRGANLDVRVGSHKQSTSFFISANYQELLMQAEKSKLRKRLKSDYGGGLQEVCLDQIELFHNVENEEFFFTSQERQSLILSRINHIRAVDKEDSPFDKITFLEDQPIFALLEANSVIEHFFPLHEPEQLQHLIAVWLHNASIQQPLDHIKEYFGTEIAFYFAWLGYYTYWLIVPTVLGLLFFINSSDQTMSDVWAVLFSIVNVVWITLFLEFWKRKSSSLAYNWGTLDQPHQLLQYPRALFQGTRQFNEITGRFELFYPVWKRWLFIGTVTVPTLVLSLIIVFGSMFITFEFQEWMDANSEWRLLRMIPKILLSVLVFLSGDFYQRAVIYLNDRENYRTEEEHRNSLIVKLGLFHFTNNFFALFYIAFYLKDMQRLKEFLAALLITRQVVGNIKEVLMPYLMDEFKKAKLTRTVSDLKDRGDRVDKKSSETPRSEVVENEKIMNEVTPKASSNDTPDVTPIPVVSVAQATTDSGERSSSTQQRESVGGVIEVGGSKDSSVKNKVQLNTSELAHKKVEGLKSKITETVVDASGMMKRIRANLSHTLEPTVTDPVEIISQASMECEMLTYDDLFDDYLEMFIQLGYVVFFSSMFPLAALCAFANNMFEIRVDGFKITHSYKRPFGKTACGIGVWQNMMDVMGAIAVMVNCGLLVSSGQLARLLPGLSNAEIVLIAVMIEHVALALKWVISKIIPDIPAWVQAEMAKVELKRMQALRDLEVLAAHGRDRTPSESLTQPDDTPYRTTNITPIGTHELKDRYQDHMHQSNVNVHYRCELLESEEESSNRNSVRRRSSNHLVTSDSTSSSGEGTQKAANFGTAV